MTGSELDQRYPIGRFRYDGDLSREAIDRSVATIAALYAWHGRHHTGHIMALRERNGWG